MALAATTADRLREVEAARLAAERQAARFADQSRLIQDRALRQEAEARRLTAEIAEAENRLEAARIRAGTAEARLAGLRDGLALGQAPLTRMLAALQRQARRPTLLLVMRPGSIRDFVRMRAMVAGLQPQIAARTASLRADLAQARTLAADAERARATGEKARSDLYARREALAESGAQGRITAQQLARQANRARRDATLAGAQALSIGQLVAEETQGRRTLAQLSALPAPNLLAGGDSGPERNGPERKGPKPQVPVAGRVLAGFGERDAAGGRSKGITIAPAPNAPVGAPLAGEVAFAGPFRGYGTVVILRHGDGLIGMLAGLDRAVVATGEKVMQGEAVGTAPARDPAILYELRRGRTAIHPLLP
ncbi:peptidoglycan DD-metalloendopeptidase family protein [Croceicoccus sp. BE223]|uniref:murein hydrolase activator EnvC family protein n=1 Tax=Croceicoccus sp. BE223 TaxID=2817716 RepID=UPI00285817BF|nr:peptidoglycan DD-metalloendopeptidase family protein [Croceicoccus sp. BE223]MDR7102214.1 septal ring factor EnvC (AmiA/AmiB activator) [Croceicoccus sp. BE223]